MTTEVVARKLKHNKKELPNMTFTNTDYEAANAKIPQQLREAMDAYCEALKADYNKTGYSSSQFYKWEAKRNYIVVWSMPSKSSHSWVVYLPDAKFECGDILKSASWRGPAKNFARGNVLKKDWARSRWSGVS